MSASYYRWRLQRSQRQYEAQRQLVNQMVSNMEAGIPIYTNTAKQNYNSFTNVAKYAAPAAAYTTKLLTGVNKKYNQNNQPKTYRRIRMFRKRYNYQNKYKKYYTRYTRYQKSKWQDSTQERKLRGVVRFS